MYKIGKSFPNKTGRSFKNERIFSRMVVAHKTDREGL